MIEHLVILLSFFLGKKICLKCFGVRNEKYNLEITGALKKCPSKWRIEKSEVYLESFCNHQVRETTCLEREVVVVEEEDNLFL